jgi:hypothetical protein
MPCSNSEALNVVHFEPKLTPIASIPTIEHLSIALQTHDINPIPFNVAHAKHGVSFSKKEESLFFFNCLSLHTTELLQATRTRKD